MKILTKELADILGELPGLIVSSGISLNGCVLTVALGILEDVGVDALRVAIQDFGSRVLSPEGNDLLLQQLVVSAGDFVEITQATIAIVLGLGATVQG